MTTLADETVEVGATIPTASRSFDAFFRREYRGVVAVVARLTGSRAVAEDVAQEAFAAAHLRWARISNYDRPDLWVRRIALNRAISLGRRRHAEARALARLDRLDAGTASADPEPPDDILWTRVRALPRRQAQLVALVYGEDRPIDQAAAALGLSASTARTHLQRARSALADVLDPPPPPAPSPSPPPPPPRTSNPTPTEETPDVP